MLSLQKSSQTFMFPFSCVIADSDGIVILTTVTNTSMCPFCGEMKLKCKLLKWTGCSAFYKRLQRVCLPLSVYVNTTSRLSPCQLLDEPQFRCITKIKTIGSTYMAASGVTPDVSNGYNSIKVSMVTWLQLQCVSWLTEPTCVSVNRFRSAAGLVQLSLWKYSFD